MSSSGFLSIVFRGFLVVCVVLGSGCFVIIVVQRSRYAFDLLIDIFV